MNKGLTYAGLFLFVAGTLLLIIAVATPGWNDMLIDTCGLWDCTTKDSDAQAAVQALKIIEVLFAVIGSAFATMLLTGNGKDSYTSNYHIMISVSLLLGLIADLVWIYACMDEIFDPEYSFFLDLAGSICMAVGGWVFNHGMRH